MSSRLDREKIKNKAAQILDITLNEADPVLLSEYRRIFKKEIPFFRRSWVAAWLLMVFDKNELSRPDRPDLRGATGRLGKKSVNQNLTKDEDQRRSLTEEESKWLFISIGKNRRVYPREIITLINSKASVSSEDIGAVRILDNYSFVQVRENLAQEVIECLNGLLFKGRTLAVNYAKSKNDEIDGAASDGNAPKQEQDHPDKKDIQAESQ